MSHAYLDRYINDRINFWREHYGNKSAVTFPLSSLDVADIVYTLEGDLSPENLHCDGEISRAEAQRKYDFYMKVHAELEAEAGHSVDICY